MKALHQIRTGIIGGGFIGPVHMEALRRFGVRVFAVGGSRSAEALAEQFGIPQVYSGYKVEQLIQSDQVDVVHITSPHRHHHAQAMAVLKAGKHVICEKPLAMTAKETLEICKEAKRRKK